MENNTNQNVSSLEYCIHKWEEFNGFRIFTAYNYAPFNSGSISQEYLGIRFLIRDFKNDTSGITEKMHDDALNTVVNLISEILKRTFGEHLDKLTFVCIPASTKESHIKRFEEFSNRLCTTLNMNNAFPYITILQNKRPKHLGGNADTDMNYSFDNGYFKDKNIILFDDVMTSGDSFTRFSKKLTLIGSKVIAAISIGQTFPPNQRPHPIYDFRNGKYDCK